jgi:hypothetical protein
MAPHAAPTGPKTPPRVDVSRAYRTGDEVLAVQLGRTIGQTGSLWPGMAAKPGFPPRVGLARSDLRVVPLEGATGGSALEHDQVASFDRRGRECERATLPRWAGLPEYRPPAQQYVHGVSGPRGVFGTAPFRHCPEIRIVAQTGCW